MCLQPQREAPQPSKGVSEKEFPSLVGARGLSYHVGENDAFNTSSMKHGHGWHQPRMLELVRELLKIERTTKRDIHWRRAGSNHVKMTRPLAKKQAPGASCTLPRGVTTGLVSNPCTTERKLEQTTADCTHKTVKGEWAPNDSTTRAYGKGITSWLFLETIHLEADNRSSPVRKWSTRSPPMELHSNQGPSPSAPPPFQAPKLLAGQRKEHHHVWWPQQCRG